MLFSLETSTRTRTMTSFKTSFAFFGLYILLDASQTSSAFEPALLRKGRTSLGGKPRQASVSRSSSSSKGFFLLDSHRQADDFEPNAETNKSVQKHIDPFSAAVRYYSTLAFASAALLLSTTLFEPASIAWADDGAASGTTAQRTILQASPKKAEIKKAEITVVDEVWNLINKYYIDRTFNGQDWSKARSQYVEQTKDADNGKTMTAVTEMVKSLGDKYTRVLDKEQYAAIQKFDLIGVGVTLMPNAQKDIIVGNPPIEGSASDKAGLKTGDLVTAINGIATKGRTAFDIIDQISENPNARTVTFSIQRQDDNDLPAEGPKFDATMERQNFLKVKDPVQYKLSEKRKDGTNVGYVRVSEFNSLVNTKLQDALDDLKRQGANAYVLDLRMNTGGAFQSAVEISAFFFEDRVATYVVDSNAVELAFRTPKGKLAVDPKAPLVIWIDGLSASASEVLAGSLHDNCRAVTMGDKSFGKGLIQAVYGLKNGAGLVMTVARYVTPAGTEIQGIGITPDIAGNMPAPVMIPVISSDTSKVDFGEISRRLDPSFCTVPTERAMKGTQSTLN